MYLNGYRAFCNVHKNYPFSLVHNLYYFQITFLHFSLNSSLQFLWKIMHSNRVIFNFFKIEKIVTYFTSSGFIFAFFYLFLHNLHGISEKEFWMNLESSMKINLWFSWFSACFWRFCNFFLFIVTQKPIYVFAFSPKALISISF